jgi:DNA polymerase-3 subunit epsilon
VNFQDYFFLDLQTTGAKPDTSNPLEMAWGDDSSTKSFLIAQPDGEKVPYRIQAITGITDEDMTEAKPLKEVLELFKADQQAVAIIHFAQFEKPFLKHIFGEELPFEVICTHEIAKRLMPNLPSRGIKGLAGYFGYNAGDVKRGQSYINATRVIWQGLTKMLVEKSITDFSGLRAWLADTPKERRTKYEYPLPKEKRLSLPDQPGIYRMISQWGEVLYVGKATSLKSRVNSYFRGQKNRDPRKLEMLTQTWDLIVTPCNSPLESALLETDEIKRLNPRYNISLKAGHRALVFFNRDFTSISFDQDEEHSIGPFPSAMAFDSMLKLAESLQQNEFNALMFYEEMAPELLKEGFKIFCERHDFEPYTFSSMRSILAVGLWWYRQQLEEEVLEEAQEEELIEEVESEEVPLTPEDVADKFERHFIRAGATYHRVRRLTTLLNSNIDFQLAKSKTSYRLIIRGGQIKQEADPTMEPAPYSWQGLAIDTYDRMSVLQSELDKIKAQNGAVHIHKVH